MPRALRQPGMYRALFGALIGGAFGFGLVVALRAISRPRDLPDRSDRLPAPHRPRDHRAARLPRRHRRLRLLVPLGRRRADDPRRPLRPRRDELARLLQVQHRPQGHRHPVHLHDLPLLLHRRPVRDDHAGRARSARHPDRRSRRLQRPLLDPRGDHDLPLRHPGLRRDRELRAAADDRRAGHGVPAPERAQLLDAADRRDPFPDELPGPRRRLRRRLDRLRAVIDRRAPRASRSSTSASSLPARPRSRPRSTSSSRSSRCVRPA